MTSALNRWFCRFRTQDFPEKNPPGPTRSVKKWPDLLLIPWFLESCVFSSHIPTLDPTFWIPSRNLPGNTQGCYPRGNACPSGSVQRFPDRWEVGHVTWTYDEKYLEVSTHISYYLVICHWILEGLIWLVRSLNVHEINSEWWWRCSIQGRSTQGFCQEDQDIFTHFTTNSGLGGRHATNKWLFGHFMNGEMVGRDGQDFPDDLSDLTLPEAFLVSVWL